MGGALNRFPHNLLAFKKLQKIVSAGVKLLLDFSGRPLTLFFL